MNVMDVTTSKKMCIREGGADVREGEAGCTNEYIYIEEFIVNNSNN